MSRRSKLLAHSLSLVWLYLVYRCIAGAIQGRPEWSLRGTWRHGGRQIECSADGAVRSGPASPLLTWQGSRFLFREAELTAAAREYRPEQVPWDLLLARQCGVLRTSDELLFDGPHVKHQKVGANVEATVKWLSVNEFSLDGVTYTRVEE